MANASGVFRRIAHKEESNYGELAGASGAKRDRRITINAAVEKEMYESEEIEDHQQVGDARHGTRRTRLSITGHLSPGSHSDYFSYLCRRAWSGVSALTGLSLTIAADGDYWTIERSAGDFLAGGIKNGHVIRITAGSVHANNANKNLVVLETTVDELTVAVLNGSALEAEGPISSCTISVVGQVTHMADSSHTDKSFNLEDWSPEVPSSEVYVGTKIHGANCSLPPSGMTRVEFQAVGKDVVSGTSAYFTSPTAASSAGSTAAVNGYLALNGGRLVGVTGLTLNFASPFTGDPEVGSNVISSQEAARMRVSGQMTVKFNSTAMRDWFLQETESSLIFVLTTSNAADADFMTFVLTRIKAGGAAKDDGEKTLIQTVPFTGLIKLSGGSGQPDERTALSMQDSTLS